MAIVARLEDTLWNVDKEATTANIERYLKDRHVRFHRDKTDMTPTFHLRDGQVVVYEYGVTLVEYTDKTPPLYSEELLMRMVKRIERDFVVRHAELAYPVGLGCFQEGK